MPTINPTIGQARPVSPLLSAIAAKLANNPERYKALQILPPLDGVTAQMKVEGVISTSMTFGDASTPTERAPHQPIEQVPGDAHSTVPYLAVEHALGTFVDRQEMTDALIDIEESRVASVVHTLALRREQRLFNKLMTSGNWPSSFAAATTWDNSAANPFANVRAAKTRVKRFGFAPNTVVLSQAALDALASNLGVLSYRSTNEDRNYVADDDILGAIEAAVGGGAKAYVMDAAANIAQAGLAVDPQYLGGTDRFCWVGYINRDEQSYTLGNARVSTIATAMLRLEVQSMLADVEDVKRPVPGRAIDVYHYEADPIVNNQLGCLITC